MLMIPLLTLLCRTIDAAVNGGILKYLERFMSSEYLTSSECDLTIMQRFQASTLYLMDITDTGLAILRRFVSGKALGLSDHLEKLQKQFKKLWREKMEIDLQEFIAKTKSETRKQQEI